jgi:hypothetical protein
MWKKSFRLNQTLGCTLKNCWNAIDELKNKSSSSHCIHIFTKLFKHEHVT